MIIDRTTKLLLLLIALGLWANAFAPSVQAQRLSDLEGTVNNIQQHIFSIATGVCLNQKIC